MDYESICCSLQTVRAARMFYEYRKLDRLLERDITTSSDDLYEVYYELLIAATDYMDQKFNEDYEYDHWYFSFRSMMQYYRLIREYGSLHSMKLSENPYVKKAEEMLSATLYPCCLNGGMGWGYQKKISAADRPAVSRAQRRGGFCFYHCHGDLYDRAGKPKTQILGGIQRWKIKRASK